MRAHALRLAASLLASVALAAHAQVAWRGEIEVARGNGLRGPWQQNESRYDFVDDPSVAIDERGDTWVAWVEQARKRVLLQRFAPGGQPRFTSPVDVSRMPRTFSWLPRIALRPGDAQQVAVLWQEIVFSGGSHGGEIFIALSRDGGRSFAPPLNLSRSPAGDGKGRLRRDHWHNGSLDVAVAADGSVYAAWTDYDGALWFSRSHDAGREFEGPHRIATPHVARAPSLAVARDGSIYLAWTHGEQPGADVFLARSADAGRSFSTPAPLTRTPGHGDAPKLAVDAQGVLHLVYSESRGGAFDARAIHYLRSRDGGRNFEPPRAISGAAADAGYPHLALDARGRVMVLWETHEGPRLQPRGLAFTVSVDGGGRFTPPAPVPGSADPRGGANGSTQGLLMRKLAANAQGAIAVVNSSLKEDAHSRVWLLRGQLP
jgi:hypothetical protein